MKDKDLQITHIPLGNEQPYFQQPFERYPRYPLSGQPITIGAVITPMDEGEYVELLWRSDERDAFQAVSAVCIGTSDSVGNSGCDRSWMAALPPQRGGDELEYYLRVSSGLLKAETERFRLTVGTAVRFTVLESFCRTAASVCLQLQSVSAEETIYLEMKHDQGHIVSTILTDGEQPDGTGSHWQNVSDDPLTVNIPDSTYDLELARCGTIRLSSSSTARPVTLYHGVELTSYAVGSTAFQELSFSIAAEPEEKFFGFGERYNKLDQRGEILQHRVFEQYKNQRLKTYMPIPFFQSSNGYGLSLDTDRNILFDICSRDDRCVHIKAELGRDRGLSCHWYFGSPKEIQGSYAQAALSQLEVPEWALGPWMSSNEWNSQRRVLSEVAATNELDIPATVVVIEAWSDESTFYIWNDAEYTPKPSDEPMTLADFTFPEDGLWPDPKGMIDQLHAEGKKLVLWQIPVVKEFTDKEETPVQQLMDQEYVEAAGLCLREEDGSAYRVRPGWFSHSKVPDLASKRGRDWWFSKRAYLMEECGVDGFKTDGGEHLWGYTIQASKAYEQEQGCRRTGDQMINTFSVSYISSYHEAMKRHEPDGIALTFSRSGCSGAGSYPCHWAGDQDSTWDAYRGALYAVLNSNISGVPVIGWDIGGFSGEIPTAELYLRSAAAAVFSPVMQYHSEFYDHVEPHVDRTPWNIAKRCDAPEVVALYRMFAKLRMELIPYISGEIDHIRKTGEPLMRPLWVDTPDDKRSWEVETTYRFGRSLLVAPVLFEGDRLREIYLPTGEWEDVWTGKAYAGSRTVTCDAPLDTIPVFRDLKQSWQLPVDLFKRIHKEL
ncbi:MAG: hypothetical protein K9M84_00450 [Spirochaetia bacterium]|nr:hypothetical protein [Spirochaetia bacterium]MCF7940057.1 hypothetical protein [Spirochaetia bacterium]